MGKKIRLFGEKAISKAVLMWSGILGFLLNLLGCTLWQVGLYAPPFYGEFKGSGQIVDSKTKLPVKGIKVSILDIPSLEYWNPELVTSSTLDSMITDETGEYEIEGRIESFPEFLVYVEDTDPESDGDYKESIISFKMPSVGEPYIVTRKIELEEK